MASELRFQKVLSGSGEGKRDVQSDAVAPGGDVEVRPECSAPVSGMSPGDVLSERFPLGPNGSYPRIHIKTLEDQGHRSKLWLYPDGGWELLTVEMPPADASHSGYVRNCKTVIVIPATETVMRIPYGRCPALAWCDSFMAQVSNAKRAATRCRRVARFNSMRYMTTLTFPASVPGDRATRIRLFQRWVQHSMGATFFRSGYLMFPEPHKSGAFHLHVLHSNRLGAVLVRAFWTAWLFKCGFSPSGGARAVRTHQKDWGSAVQAAAYASKYVSKMFSGNAREQGKRRYYPSLGLVDGHRLLVAPDLVTVQARFSRSQVRSWSDPDAVVAWFYCGGDENPPDLSEWPPWVSVN